MIPAAMIGASIGGMIALLLGAQLSRQYCWLFALTAGLIGIPALMYTTSQLSFAFNVQRRVPPLIAGWGLEFLMLLGPLAGGAVLAIVMTRRRIGLARRSRRAAWIGL